MTEEAYILNNVQRSFVESDSGRGNWWTERGSIRWVFTDEERERVIDYVNDPQDRKHLKQN